tara:strand:- start:245 stop:1036 length:792 start_codon:yes stop_codon:yes gene_type:complete
MVVKNLRLIPGEVVFREGEPSGEAFRITSGSVRISLNISGGSQVISHLHQGEIFGEMGMIDAMPRSATATAFDETVLEVITKEGFFDYIASDEALRSEYLRCLFNRLRDSCSKLRATPGLQASSEYMGRDDQTLEDVFFNTSLDDEKTGHENRKVQFFLNTPECDPTEITIERFPFRIGRRSASNDFCVQDKKPYHVSRNHCCIEEECGHFFIRDLGSKVGTIVNGKRIAEEAAGTSEELALGENTITLGHDNSPHRFRVVLS